MFESKPKSLSFFLILIYLSSVSLQVNSQCNKGCDLALASFYVWRGTDLNYIARLFSIPTRQQIMEYNNRDNIPNQDSVIAGTRINIPFRCDCLNDVDFLGHVFQYQIKTGDTYDRIVSNYSDLTSVDLLRRFNSRYTDNNIPNGVNLSVVVNCSCGDRDVSEDFGLFVTYPLRPEENLTYVATTTNVSDELIRRYNSGVDAKFRAGEGIIYVPGRGWCSCSLIMCLFYFRQEVDKYCIWRNMHLI